MKQILFLIIFSFFFNFFNYSKSFKENSIGIVYLTGETETEYEVEVVFPFNCMTGYSVESPLLEIKEVMAEFETDFPITLFDSNGELIKIEQTNSFEIVFWCENDGGIQFRPRLKLKLEKENFNRKIEANYEIQDIACFALVNRNKNITYGQVSSRSLNEDIRLKGDLNNDGKFEALIWVVPDDAQNCSGSPENNLVIFLSYNGQDYWMRCCGP